MALLRLVMNFLVAGALLGVLVATLLYPRYMAWDNTPGSGKALCDCAETTRQTAEKLINGQMVGCATGAGLGALAGFAFAIVRRKKPVAAQTAVAGETKERAR